MTISAPVIRYHGSKFRPVGTKLYGEEALAQRDAELAELRGTIASLRQHKNEYMDAAEETRKALQAELAAMRSQEPIAHQFQGRNGEWCVFQSQKHYEDTAADGSWPIRALYAAPVSAPSQVSAEVVPVCATCDGNGAVGTMLTAEPCPDCCYSDKPVAAEVVPVPRELLADAHDWLVVMRNNGSEAQKHNLRSIIPNLRALLATSQGEAK